MILLVFARSVKVGRFCVLVSRSRVLVRYLAVKSASSHHSTPRKSCLGGYESSSSIRLVVFCSGPQNHQICLGGYESFILFV
jgi:hypothetical protein